MQESKEEAKPMLGPLPCPAQGRSRCGAGTLQQQHPCWLPERARPAPLAAASVVRQGQGGVMRSPKHSPHEKPTIDGPICPSQVSKVGPPAPAAALQGEQTEPAHWRQQRPMPCQALTAKLSAVKMPPASCQGADLSPQCLKDYRGIPTSLLLCLLVTRSSCASPLLQLCLSFAR